MYIWIGFWDYDTSAPDDDYEDDEMYLKVITWYRYPTPNNPK